MTKNINVKLNIDTGDVREKLDGVRAATEGMGDEGVQNANQLVGAMEGVADSADKIAQRIESGKSVSESSLNGMRQNYVGLNQAIVDTFGTLEQAPEEVKAAFAATEGVITQTAAKVRQAQQAAADAKESFDKLATEAKDDLGNAFERAQGALDEFSRKLNEEGDVGKGEVEKITKAQALLEMEIRKTAGGYDKLDAEAKKTYDKIQAEARKAVTITVELEKANEDVERSLDGAIRGYTTLDDALDQVRARLGDVGMGAIAAGGAFATGWQQGMAINAKLRTDMSEFDSYLSGFFNRLSLIVRATVDQIVANLAVVGGAWEAIKTRSMEPLTKAMTEAGKVGEDTGKLLSTAFTGTATEVQNLQVQFGIASDALDRNKAAAELAAEAAKKKAEEDAKLAEQQKKLQIEAAKLNLALAEQRDLMQQGEQDASRSRAQGNESADQLKNTEANMRRVEDAIESLRDKLAQQTAEYGENSAAARNTASELKKYEDQLMLLERQHAQLGDKLEKYREQEDAATESAKRAADAAKTLEKQKTDLAKETAALNGTTQDSIWLQDHTTVSMGKAGEAQAEYRNETVLVTDAKTGEKTVTQQLVLVTEQNTETTKTQTDEQKKAKVVVDDTTKALEGLAAVKLDKLKTEVGTLKQEIDALAASARTAATAITKLSKSGGDDGDDDGISITRADGSSIEPGSLGGGFKGSPTGGN